MLKVKNKKVINELANITYQANKKRNCLTIFAIIMTTTLIAVVIATGVSYWNTLSQRQIRMVGMDYDIELSEPTEGQTEKIRSMDKVKYAGISVKCAIIQQYKNKSLSKTRLYYLDEICFEKQTIPAFEEYVGNYPKNDNEILFSYSTLNSMGISNPKIGMKLPFTYITLSEKAENTIEKTLEKEFILCGWYKEYSGNDRGYVSKEFLETTGVRQTDFTQGSLKITLHNPLYSEKDIADMMNQIEIGKNQVLRADLYIITNFFKTAAGLLAMLLLIFLSGYLFIYNTLYISISKDVRYYGQLKTIGMTSVQLKAMIYRQAVWNSFIGIPVGLIVSLIISKLVIPKLINAANPVLEVNEIASADMRAFLAAGVFALLVNLISCKIPAKMVGQCSPITALHYTGSTKRRKYVKREHSSLYTMALQNMFRNKKQAFVIILSFVIAVTIYFIVNVVIRGNNAEIILNDTFAYDIRFMNETTLDNDRKQLFTVEKLEEIKKIPGVKSLGKVSSAIAVVPYQEEVYGEYYKKLYESRYSPGNYEEDMKIYKQNPENPFFTTRFIGVDEVRFQNLNKSMGNILDQEAFMRGEIAVAVNSLIEGDNNMTGKTADFYLPDGSNPTKKDSIKIAAVGSRGDNPAYFAGGYTPDFIVSNQYAKELLGDLFIELVDINYEKAFSRETEQLVKAVFADENNITDDSKLNRYSDMKNSETQIKVLGNSIGFILAILAVLNYLNMMAANIQNRSKEFAILESIGMTGKQIIKMLRLEGIGYAVISIIFSLVFCIPLSYGVFSNMNHYQIPFSIPWANNLILFLIVAAVCVASPVFIYHKSQNKSIMEQLRTMEG